MSRLTLITLYRRGLALRLTCHTVLSLPFEVGVRPPHDGIRGWGGSICRAPLPQSSGRIGGRYELTPPVVPVRTFLLPKLNVLISLTAVFPAFSAAASGNRRYRGAVLTPAELAIVDPHPVQNDSQTPGDRDDRSTHPASLSHSHAPCLQPRPFCAASKEYKCRLVKRRAQQGVFQHRSGTPP